jgi:hypothetical protein
MRASHLICCVLVSWSLSACHSSPGGTSCAPGEGAACGSSPAPSLESGSAASSRSPNQLMSQIAQACAALVTAECQQRAACGPVNLDACLRGVDRCSTFFGEMTRRKVEQGYLVWDPSQLAACVASPGTHSCVTGSFTWSPACRDLVRPNRTLGQACFPEEEHLNPSTCVTGWCPEGHGETGPCPAACKAFRAQGERCGDAEPCDTGLQCSKGTCVPPARVGEACGETACGSGLWCAPQRAGGSACAVQAGAGTACDFDPSCQSGLCLNGMCAVDSALGQRCNDSDQCGKGNVCTVVPVNDTGTLQLRCSARLPLGSPCDRDDVCALGAICEGNRCVTSAPAAAGQPCFRSTCQAGSFCGRTTNTCLAKSSAGGTCSNDRNDERFDACAAGLSCSATNTCQPVAAPGAACSEAVRCPETYYCGPQNTCAPKQAWGSSCAKDPECYSGSCSATSNTCAGYCTP